MSNLPTDSGDDHARRWWLTESVRLVRLEPGGHILVDLADLSCHELSDEAAQLLIAGELTDPVDSDEHEFVAHCLAAGWVLPAHNSSDPGQGPALREGRSPAAPDKGDTARIDTAR